MYNVSIIIVTHNSEDTLRDCLASLPPVEVIVVDNASTDGTRAIAREYPNITLIENQNVGFGAACNLGVSHSKNDFILLLNPDAALTPGALDVLLASLDKHPECAIIGPRIIEPTGEIELSWGQDPGILSEWKRKKEHQTGGSEYPQDQSVDWISGACMLIRREAWDAIKGFDPGFFLYFEDADLCRRLRLEQWTIRYHAAATINHIRGHSGKNNHAGISRWYRESQLRYYERHAAFHERILLRLYLFGKFFPKALRGDTASKSILVRILAPLNAEEQGYLL